MNQVQKAIIKTLCYSAVFHYPLDKGQLWRFLIYSKKSPKISAFLQELNFLVKQKKVYQIKNCYLLKKNRSWISIKEKEKKQARKKEELLSRIVFFLSFIFSIELIGLTGRLALGVAKKDDDLDLLIITKKDTLWLTRLLVLFLLSLLKVRRKAKDKQAKDKVCVNMFLSRSHLQIPLKEQDLYSAHELCQMKPLFARNNCYTFFINQNQWVREYLPNALPKRKKIKRKRKNNFLLLPWENLAYFFQIKLINKKKTKEIVRKNYVRFHPQDARIEILKKYNKLINIYL